MNKSLAFITIILLLLLGCKKDTNNNANNNGSSHSYGYSPTPDSLYNLIPSASIPAGGGSLPNSFFLQVPTAFNQYSLGSCVSCATAMQKSVLDHTKMGIAYPNNSIIYSPSYLFNQCHLSSNCGDGSYCTANLNVLLHQGDCLLADMPYTTDCSLLPLQTQINAASNHKISQYSRINPIDVGSIKQFIYAGTPVILAFSVDDIIDATHSSDWTWDHFGNANNNLGHCVLIYGWDDSRNAVRILNSWGDGWADHGSFWIDYNFLNSGITHTGARVFYEAYVIQNAQNNTTTLAADFSASNTNPSIGSIVSFSDFSTGNPNSWSWSFPGGTPNTSTSQNPTVTYSSAGYYSATLNVSNGITSDTKTKTNYINVSQNNNNPCMSGGSIKVTNNYGQNIRVYIDNPSGNGTADMTVPSGSTASKTSVSTGRHQFLVRDQFSSDIDKGEVYINSSCDSATIGLYVNGNSSPSGCTSSNTGVIKIVNNYGQSIKVYLDQNNPTTYSAYVPAGETRYLYDVSIGTHKFEILDMFSSDIDKAEIYVSQACEIASIGSTITGVTASTGCSTGWGMIKFTNNSGGALKIYLDQGTTPSGTFDIYIPNGATRYHYEQNITSHYYVARDIFSSDVKSSGYTLSYACQVHTETVP